MSAQHLVGPQPSHHLCRKERGGQKEREREIGDGTHTHNERGPPILLSESKMLTHVSLIFQILIINTLIVDNFFAHNGNEETEN